MRFLIMSTFLLLSLIFRVSQARERQFNLNSSKQSSFAREFKKTLSNNDEKALQAEAKNLINNCQKWILKEQGSVKKANNMHMYNSGCKKISISELEGGQVEIKTLGHIGFFTDNN